jgi:hypothetical protein
VVAVSESSSPDRRPFLLAALSLAVLVLGSTTLLTALARARERVEAYR